MQVLNIKRLRCRKLITLNVISEDTVRLQQYLSTFSDKVRPLTRWVYQSLLNQLTSDLKAGEILKNDKFSFTYLAEISLNHHSNDIVDKNVNLLHLKLDFKTYNEYDELLRLFIGSLSADDKQFKRWVEYALINQMKMDLCLQSIIQHGGMTFDFARSLSSVSMDARATPTNLIKQGQASITPQSPAVNHSDGASSEAPKKVDVISPEKAEPEPEGDTFELDSGLAGLIALDDDFDDDFDIDDVP
jgi:hypothetical protein